MGAVQSCYSTLFTRSKTTIKNETVDESSKYARDAPQISGEGRVHVLIIALDYKGSKWPLTCTVDAKSFKELCEACDIENENIHEIYDWDATVEAVEEKFEDIGEQAEDGDFLVVFYSGHGHQIEDKSGDEEDGYDEAFMLSGGAPPKIKPWLDDDFVRVVTNNIDPGVQIIVLTDCCHSKTICDLHSHYWDDFEVIAISGCTDEQVSADTGAGGVLSHCLFFAIDSLQRLDESEYSVGKLFNRILLEDHRVFKSKQDMSITCTAKTKTNKMAWPLLPVHEYDPPKERLKMTLTSAPTGLEALSCAAKLSAYQVGILNSGKF